MFGNFNCNRLALSLAAFLLLCLGGSTASAQPLVFLPFANNTPVRCVQGNNGSFSHSSTKLRNSYDFDMGPGPNSTANPVYGLALHSPVNGVIAEVRAGVPDFSNNTSSNTSNNGGLGNTISISFVAHDGRTYYMRFAHLQNGSIPSTFRSGTSITQGQFIGRIGQTGYSTTPHLHLHVSTSVNGDSVPFNFVEGPVNTGTWIRSQLQPNKFVIDNDGRVTAGFPISNISVRVGVGTWSNFGWVANTFGTNYRGSTTTGAIFRWTFRYTLPSNSNVRLSFYARCPSNSNRDRSAIYHVGLTGDSGSVRTTVDQRNIGSSMAFIGTRTHRGGTQTADIQVNRSGNTVCADGIIVYRH